MKSKKPTEIPEAAARQSAREIADLQEESEWVVLILMPNGEILPAENKEQK